MPKLKTRPQNAFLGTNSRLKKEKSDLEKRIDCLHIDISEAKEELCLKEKELEQIKSQLKVTSTTLDNQRRKLKHKQDRIFKLNSLTASAK